MNETVSSTTTLREYLDGKRCVAFVSLPLREGMTEPQLRRIREYIFGR